MLTSVLVKQLQEVIARDGDIEVLIPAEATSDTREDDQVEIAGLSTLIDENEKALSVLICDQHTLDAFINCDDVTDGANVEGVPI